MTLTWGSFRTIVRRSILKDHTPDEDTGEFRWSDDELLDAARWALDTFAQHTAVASGTSYTGDGSTTSWTLPSNLFSAESFDETGEVIIHWTGKEPEYLDPIRATPLLSLRDSTAYGFYTDPADPYRLRLRTRTVPGAGERIAVHYYAHYPRPASDSDALLIPQWAEGPLAFLTGSYALAAASLKTSFIRQWGAKPDTGTPMQNPVRDQQQWFMAMYERELLRHPPQVRKTTLRRDDRD